MPATACNRDPITAVNSSSKQPVKLSSKTFSALVLPDDSAQFKLLTSYDRNGRQLTTADLTRTTINPLRRVILLASPREYRLPLTEGYLNKDNYNLFVVEWSGGTEQAGKEVGEFLGVLLNVTGEKYLDYHLVGVEDGCGICRTAATELNKLAGRKVNRITQLEPLNFEEDSGRGDFVDVVTCGKSNQDNKVEGDVNCYVIGKEGGE